MPAGSFVVTMKSPPEYGLRTARPLGRRSPHHPDYRHDRPETGICRCYDEAISTR
jgi:hypothetical protein